ncbi:MAG: polysaccharide biosynthesis/export family protein [Candidatus Cloacimonas sp.]|jgi:protein involved in polysaccharide export with SLBB domain|nr:polysaccharide biosynthesis/export family protein [Candidatus Cloacimonadota bacterium]
MKHKLVPFIAILFLVAVSALLAYQRVDVEKEYTVKPGDKFAIQVVTLETKEFVVPVTLSGNVVMYPLTNPVEVAGLTLEEAKALLKSEIAKNVINAKIVVELIAIAPYSLHLLGAFNSPGEYPADSLMTLSQSLRLARGLHPSASRKINITRRGETKTFDLNRYLTEGDITQNPLVMGDDLITAAFAENFVKVYVVTDTTNYVEYFEINENTKVNDLLPAITHKNYYSDFNKIFIKRDGEITRVEQSHVLNIGDSVYLHPEESYILVRGNVNIPGKYSFHGGKSAHYYISLAGGINRVGSSKRIIIVDKNGNRTKYKGQPLNEGDAVLVPVSFRTYVSDYLTPIGTIFSLVTTIIVLTK